MFGVSKTSRQALMGLYTVYDRVAEEAGPCFLAVNDAVAIRQYRQLLKDSQVVTDDEYHLFRLGSYDYKSMQISAQAPVRVLVPSLVEDMMQPRLHGDRQEVSHV